MGRHSRPDDEASATPSKGQWVLPRDGTPDKGVRSDRSAAQDPETQDPETQEHEAQETVAEARVTQEPQAKDTVPQTSVARGRVPQPNAARGSQVSNGASSFGADGMGRAATGPGAAPPPTASGTAPPNPFGQRAVRGKPPLSDHTQVIPRVPAATAAPSGSTRSTALATPYPATSALYPTGSATVAPNPNPTTVFPRPRLDEPSTSTAVDQEDIDPGAVTAAGRDGIDHDPHGEPATADAPRHHRLAWFGLAIFWLLGLGAGLVTLTSLGARASCTGSDKSLDCGNTGSAIAVVLTLCVIVLVGAVSVHALEVRDRAKSWTRDLGLGVVILLVLSFAAWRLILTING